MKPTKPSSSLFCSGGRYLGTDQGRARYRQHKIGRLLDGKRSVTQHDHKFVGQEHPRKDLRENATQARYGEGKKTSQRRSLFVFQPRNFGAHDSGLLFRCSRNTGRFLFEPFVYARKVFQKDLDKFQQEDLRIQPGHILHSAKNGEQKENQQGVRVSDIVFLNS